MAHRRGAALLGLAVLTTVLLTWVWLGNHDQPEMAAEAISPPSVGALPSVDVAPPRPRLQDAGSPVEAIDSAPATMLATGAPAGAGSLLVTLTWSSDDTPAVDIGLTFCSLADSDWRCTLPLQHGRTDAAGRCRLDELPAGRFGLAVDRTEATHFDSKWTIVSGQSCEVTMRIARGPTVRGLVRTPTGEPASGAAIQISDEFDSSGSIVTTSDESGRFEIGDLSCQRELSAHKPGYSASARHRVDGRSRGDGDDGPSPDRVIDVQLVLGLPGGSIRGVVLDPRGEPVPGAIVTVGGGGVWLPPPDSGQYVSACSPLRTRSDAQGCFDFTDVRAGPAPLAARAADLAPWLGEVEVVAGETASARIELEESGRLEGTVRDAQGRPIQGAQIMTGELELLTWSDTTSDGEGHYRLKGLSIGDVHFVAQVPLVQFVARTRLSISAGTTHTWDPLIDLGLELRGRVLRQSGEPVRGVRVTAESFGMGNEIRASTDAAGSFRLLECPSGPLSVRFRDHSAATEGADNLVLTDVYAGRDDLLVTLPFDTGASAHVEVRVVDAAGLPVANVHVQLVLPGSRKPRQLDAGNEPGNFRGGPFPPGEYRLVAGRNLPFDGASMKVVLRAHESIDAGVLTLPKPARLLAHLRASDPSLLQHSKVILSTPDGLDLDGLNPGAGGTARSGELAPGTYFVELAGNLVATELRSVTVEPGETAELHFDLVRGVPCTVSVEMPVRLGHTPYLQLVVHPADDSLPRTARLFASRSQDGTVWQVSQLQLLSAGVHRVQILLDGVVVREELLVAPPQANGELAVRLD